MPPATVAVLEEAGYRTLNDIIDLEREDFLELPGIAPEEADRIMAILDELTEEGSEESSAGRQAMRRRRRDAAIDGRRGTERRCSELLRLLGSRADGQRWSSVYEQVRDAAQRGQAAAGGRCAGRVTQQPGQGPPAASRRRAFG